MLFSSTTVACLVNWYLKYLLMHIHSNMQVFNTYFLEIGNIFEDSDNILLKKAYCSVGNESSNNLNLLESYLRGATFLFHECSSCWGLVRVIRTVSCLRNALLYIQICIHYRSKFTKHEDFKLRKLFPCYWLPCAGHECYASHRTRGDIRSCIISLAWICCWNNRRFTGDLKPHVSE